MSAVVCAVSALLLSIPLAAAQSALLTVGKTDQKGAIDITFDCTLPTQSLVFSVFNGTQPVTVLGATPIYFEASIADNEVTLFAKKDALPAQTKESPVTILVDSSWYGQPQLCVDHVEAKGVSGDDALVPIDIEVSCPGAYIPDPTPPAPISIVNTKLSCDSACGDRATNGKEDGDPQYQYCLCTDQCNSNLQIFTASCCEDYKDVCSDVQDGSCITKSDGVSSNLCGTYNDNDLCSCTADCTDPGNNQICCPDFTTICLSPPPPPLSSCQGACSVVDETLTGVSCYCDLWCTYFEDCCPDYEDECGEFTTCEGFCGQVSSGDDQNECQCDELCVAYNDCCSDYTEKCGVPGLGKGEKAGTVPCVEGDCGGCKADCCCNIYCTWFGNCCESYNSVCGVLAYPPPPDSTDDLPGNNPEKANIVSKLPYTFTGTFEGFTVANQNVGSVASKCNGKSTTAADVFFQIDVSSASLQSLEMKLTINADNVIYTHPDDFIAAISVYEIGDDIIWTEVVEDGPACTQKPDDRSPPMAGDSFTAEQGVGYFVVISAFAKPGAEDPVNLGDFSLTIDHVAGDRMQNPIVIDSLDAGSVADIPSTTLGYTDTFTPDPDSDDKQCTSPDGSSDVWFEYIPQQDETLKLSLCTIETNYKAIVHVLKSKASDDPEHVKCALTTAQDTDGSCKGYSVEFTINVTQEVGLKWYFVVETKRTSVLGSDSIASGDFRLIVESLLGDTSGSPIVITEVPQKITGSTEGYTNTTSPPDVSDCNVGTDSPDVFYKYAATVSRDIVIRLCFENSLDAVLYTYKVDPDTKTPVEETAQCNDDSGGSEACGLGSALVLSVTEGEEYFIVVDAKSDVTGAYTLYLEYAECDNVLYPCIIDIPYNEELSMAAHADSVTTPSECGYPSGVNGVDLVLEYSATKSSVITMQVCSEFNIFSYILKAKGQGTEVSECFSAKGASCIEEKCVNYLTTVTEGSTYYIVFEGHPFASKEGGVVIVGDDISDYEFTVDINEGDTTGGDNKICAAIHYSPPTDDESGGSNAGAIVGILFGVLAGIGLLAGGFFYLKSKGYQIPLLGQKNKGLSLGADDMTGAGNYEALNMD